MIRLMVENSELEMISNKVSIIMPTNNCAEYIAESVKSVIAQTYENWELIIADDCSTDDTFGRLKEFLLDNRIKYFCMEKQGGPAAARNSAIEKAKGEYIAFLDSDDLWNPRKLELQLEFMHKNNALLSCTAYEVIDELGNTKEITVIPPKTAGYRKVFLRGNTVGNSTAVYDRRKFADAKIPNILKRNDFALWLELTRGGEKFYGLRQPLAQYRVRKSSVSSNKLALVKYQWQLYRKIEKHSVLVSALAFVTLAFFKALKKIKYMISRAC